MKTFLKKYASQAITAGIVLLSSLSALAGTEPNPCPLNWESSRYFIQLMSRDQSRFWAAGEGLNFRITAVESKKTTDLQTDAKSCLTLDKSILNDGELYTITHVDSGMTWDAIAFKLGSGGSLSFYVGASLNIHFVKGSAEIDFKSPGTENSVQKLVELTNTYRGRVIEISGHTDSDGDAATNLKLSKARAETLKQYLIEKGVPKNSIKTQGYGKTKPVASNATPEGKAQNRRIEIEIQ